MNLRWYYTSAVAAIGIKITLISAMGAACRDWNCMWMGCDWCCNVEIECINCVFNSNNEVK